MNRQLSFQECREAFAARRGRFVVMHKTNDSSSSLHTPIASVAASFDTLDVADDNENGDVGAAGIGDLCVPSIAAGAASVSTNPTAAVPPWAHGVPSTIIGWAGKRMGGQMGTNDNNNGGGDDLWRLQMMRGSLRAGAEVRRADSGVV
jgi:hypothetical protein